MKYLLVGTFALFYVFSFATYNGEKNFLGTDVEKYVGETLILKSKPQKYQADGYEGFYLDYKKPGYSHDGGERSNVYKCCDKYGAKYAELASKKFKVLEVIAHPQSQENSLKYGSIFFLKLERLDTKDVVFYKYDARFENSFAFVVEKYLNFRAEQNKGKKFVTRGANWMPNHTSIKDINTGETVAIQTAQEWLCEDVRIDENTGLLALILKNDAGNSVAFDVEKLDDHKYVFRGEDADRMKEEYGEKSYLQILKSEVVVGFTTEMVKLTWGEPDQIEDFGASGQQWFFQGYYILVKDDKVIAVQ